MLLRKNIGHMASLWYLTKLPRIQCMVSQGNGYGCCQNASMDWRKKLDSQKGAVLAIEIKNNGFKVAKWTISAILAGSAFIKFGSV